MNYRICLRMAAWFREINMSSFFEQVFWWSGRLQNINRMVFEAKSLILGDFGSNAFIKGRKAHDYSASTDMWSCWHWTVFKWRQHYCCIKSVSILKVSKSFNAVVSIDMCVPVGLLSRSVVAKIWAISCSVFFCVLFFSFSHMQDPGEGEKKKLRSTSISDEI